MLTELVGFARFVDRSVVVDKLLSCVRALVNDENQHARAALAKEVSGLAPILGKEA